MNYTKGQKVKVGFGVDESSAPFKVILVGELKDGRYLCERMPISLISAHGKGYYVEGSGLFPVDKIEGVHEEVL